ncbi:hypothetical protein [Acrocarpospora sp. B8E8]|uniref:hypothetical protein n=1 Tax=Acrocarpospora sp. B8E8 TaxID=3153572 RepID=UPI00325DC3E0
MSDEDKDLGGVFVGTRQIYEGLLALTHEVKSLVAKLDNAAEKSDDHEVRVRALERWKYATSAALLAALVALIAEIVRIVNA